VTYLNITEYFKTDYRNFTIPHKF